MDKWGEKYPHAMRSWYDNRDCIRPFFKFSATARKVIYTTNAVESLNDSYRRLNRPRSIFLSEAALLKALALSTFENSQKWKTKLRDQSKVCGEMSIMDGVE